MQKNNLLHIHKWLNNRRVCLQKVISPFLSYFNEQYIIWNVSFCTIWQWPYFKIFKNGLIGFCEQTLHIYTYFLQWAYSARCDRLTNGWFRASRGVILLSGSMVNIFFSSSTNSLLQGSNQTKKMGYFNQFSLWHQNINHYVVGIMNIIQCY